MTRQEIDQILQGIDTLLMGMGSATPGPSPGTPAAAQAPQPPAPAVSPTQAPSFQAPQSAWNAAMGKWDKWDSVQADPAPRIATQAYGTTSADWAKDSEKLDAILKATRKLTEDMSYVATTIGLVATPGRKSSTAPKTKEPEDKTRKNVKEAGRNIGMQLIRAAAAVSM